MPAGGSMPFNTPSFTKSKRFHAENFKQIVTPGPGSYQESQVIGYNSQFSPIKKGYTMRPKTNLLNKQIPTPGPGNYEHRVMIGTKHSGTSKSMSAILNQSHFSNARSTPGPGRYLEEQQGTLTRRAPSYSMRPKTRHLLAGFPNNPGPGQYEADTSFNSSSTLKRGIRKSMGKRYGLGTREAPKPGPGQYTPNKLGSRSSPAYTMRPKTQAIKQGSKALDFSPGPGAYQTQEFIGKVRPRNHGL